MFVVVSLVYFILSELLGISALKIIDFIICVLTYNVNIKSFTVLKKS